MPLIVVLLSRSLSGITALNNQANVYFRLIDLSMTSASGGSVGTGGTDRVDNFTISATPEPATFVTVSIICVFGSSGGFC